VSWEERLGQTVLAHLAPAEARCTDPVLQGRVDAILSAVTARSGSPYTFKVTVVDEDTLNAFAAPGGQIVILRGLLARTHTPEEFAGVLAHEAQHVIRRHATRAILQHASAGVLVGALTGDVSGVAAFGLDAARNLGLLRYSRDHESEADEAGLRMLLDAGIDPAGMVAFYDVLAREARSLPAPLHYLSTHPATAERIARIRRLAKGLGAPTLSLGSADEWAEVTARCRADSKPDATR
jgi:predicted Zn-dependent protease